MAERFTGQVTITRTGGSDPTVAVDGDNGNLAIGGDGRDGDFAIFDRDGKKRFNFSGDGAIFVVMSPDGNELIRIDGHHANLEIGGNGRDGDFAIFDRNRKKRFNFSGDGAAFVVLSPDGSELIRIDGEMGDIIFRHADGAEEFDVAPEVEAAPGTVMVMDDSGYLVPSSHAYDCRVVGVVAGAGPYRPGIVMDRQPAAQGPRSPISVVGKVTARVDASGRPVRAGDLLTTSDTSGCAMVAADRQRRPGATLGKALTNLESGVGDVAMLVALQ